MWHNSESNDDRTHYTVLFFYWKNLAKITRRRSAYALAYIDLYFCFLVPTVCMKNIFDRFACGVYLNIGSNHSKLYLYNYFNEYLNEIFDYMNTMSFQIWLIQEYRSRNQTGSGNNILVLQLNFVVTPNTQRM